MAKPNRIPRHHPAGEIANRANRMIDHAADQPQQPTVRNPQDIRILPRERQLTLPEALSMVSELARDFRAGSQDMSKTANDRKQAAIALGVLLDKYCILSGRPTQIIRMDDESREAIRTLADKIGQAGDEQGVTRQVHIQQQPEDGLALESEEAKKTQEIEEIVNRWRDGVQLGTLPDLPQSGSGNLDNAPDNQPNKLSH